MAYPFVQSRIDIGPRRGPILGFVVHMAQGGGTVGYLDGTGPNGNTHDVSVHFVIEGTGRIVQMLREDHAHTSIRTSAIRMTDDADGFFGRTAAKAVLGAWADIASTLGPNHATLAVECEGFAEQGPNDKQVSALVTLINDVRGRYPRIGLLGHRDFASYKACPGRLIPWDSLGGHGPAQESTEVRFANSSGYGVTSGKRLALPAGTVWTYLDGSYGGKFASAATVEALALADSATGKYVIEIGTGVPYADKVTRPTLVMVETTATLTDAPADSTPYSAADLENAKAAQHEATRAAAIAAVEAL